MSIDHQTTNMESSTVPEVPNQDHQLPSVQVKAGSMEVRGSSCKLEMLVLKNFMTHSEYTKEWNQNLNFIMADKDKVERTILTGILLGLGAKSFETGPGHTLSKFIKHGNTFCTIQLTLANNGALPVDEYGNKIIVLRYINSKIFRYRIKTPDTSYRHLDRDEYERIKLALQIMPENPLQFPSQIESKSFLEISNKNQLYDLVSHALGWEDGQQLLNTTSSTLKEGKDRFQKKTKEFDTAKTHLEALQSQHPLLLKKLEDSEQLLKNLKNEKQVNIFRQKFETTSQDLVKINERIQKANSDIAEATRGQKSILNKQAELQRMQQELARAEEGLPLHRLNKRQIEVNIKYLEKRAEEKEELEKLRDLCKKLKEKDTEDFETKEKNARCDVIKIELQIWHLQKEELDLIFQNIDEHNEIQTINASLVEQKRLYGTLNLQFETSKVSDSMTSSAENTRTDARCIGTTNNALEILQGKCTRLFEGVQKLEMELSEKLQVNIQNKMNRHMKLKEIGQQITKLEENISGIQKQAAQFVPRPEPSPALVSCLKQIDSKEAKLQEGEEHAKMLKSVSLQRRILEGLLIEDEKLQNLYRRLEEFRNLDDEAEAIQSNITELENAQQKLKEEQIKKSLELSQITGYLPAPLCENAEDDLGRIKTKETAECLERKIEAQQLAITEQKTEENKLLFEIKEAQVSAAGVEKDLRELTGEFLNVECAFKLQMEEVKKRKMEQCSHVLSVFESLVRSQGLHGVVDFDHEDHAVICDVGNNLMRRSARLHIQIEENSSIQEMLLVKMCLLLAIWGNMRVPIYIMGQFHLPMNPEARRVFLNLATLYSEQHQEKQFFFIEPMESNTEVTATKLRSSKRAKLQ